MTYLSPELSLSGGCCCENRGAQMTTLRVADHTRTPGGRYSSDGPFSGEWFRETILRPALEKAVRDGDRISVELDGTSGYGASFLEEAFGGLVRNGAFRREQLQSILTVVAKTRLFAPYKELADRYIQQAQYRSAA
jgi:hypothetical protein